MQINKDKKILLYSGGLDSYILWKLYDFDKVIFFNIGTPGNIKELELVKKIIPREKLEIIELPLNRFDIRNTGIIAYRNNIFVLLASFFGNKIYIGVNKEDFSRDKDYVFINQMEGIMNYWNLDKNRMNNNFDRYEIIMPFKNLTRVELLKLYQEKGLDFEDMKKESRSCWKGTEKECGTCLACVKKQANFKEIGLDISDWFENPIDNPELEYQKLENKLTNNK